LTSRRIEELESFLAERGDQLLRTAVLLAIGTQAGKDMLQSAIERLLPRCRKFDGDPEAYLRRTMVNLAVAGERQAPWLSAMLAARYAVPGSHACPI
jgi:DNA-directed RNA polymerase specialized sigma24 family protein